MVKRAVSFGINYFGTRNELRGCINDTKDIVKTLTQVFGYDPKNITVITDAKNNSVKPTRNTIIKTLQNLVSQTKAGDTLFVHYSGHGYYVRERSFDETDNKDELLCPCDGTTISDDELYDILVKDFPKGAKLRVIFDCCHSGSALDLPIRYTDNGGIFKENDRETKDLDCLMISGCRDDQTSADAYIGGYKGALTWGFSKVCQNLKKSKTTTGSYSWKQLITVVRYTLRNKRFAQVPQLSTMNPEALDGQVDI